MSFPRVNTNTLLGSAGYLKEFVSVGAGKRTMTELQRPPAQSPPLRYIRSKTINSGGVAMASGSGSRSHSKRERSLLVKAART